jgi:hypothetical protein
MRRGFDILPAVVPDGEDKTNPLPQLAGFGSEADAGVLPSPIVKTNVRQAESVTTGAEAAKAVRSGGVMVPVGVEQATTHPARTAWPNANTNMGYSFAWVLPGQVPETDWKGAVLGARKPDPCRIVAFFPFGMGRFNSRFFVPKKMGAGAQPTLKSLDELRLRGGFSGTEPAKELRGSFGGGTSEEGRRRWLGRRRTRQHGN